MIRSSLGFSSISKEKGHGQVEHTNRPESDPYRHQRIGSRRHRAGISKLLADTYTLYLTTHNFHWNVTGPMFSTLHLMFMEQYTELWNAVDPIAERIRALGHWAPGSYAQYQALASLGESPAIPPKAKDMIRTLVSGHETVARTAREIFPLVEAANDQPTAGYLRPSGSIHAEDGMDVAQPSRGINALQSVGRLTTTRGAVSGQDQAFIYRRRLGHRWP